MKNEKLPINRVEAAGIIVEGLRKRFPDSLYCDFLFGDDHYTFVRGVVVDGERRECAQKVDAWALANVSPSTNLAHLIDLFESDELPVQ